MKIIIKEGSYSNYEGNEILWSYAKTKEKAYLEMVFCLLNSEDRNRIKEIDFDKISSERVFYCDKCEFSSSGSDDICCECGEPTGKIGKHVWQFNLP